MVESVPPKPSPQLVSPSSSADSPSPPPLAPPPPSSSRPLFTFPKRPSVRVTSEFDSDSTAFTNRISCKLFDGLAKLKLSFQNDKAGQVTNPLFAFVSKNLSVHYDPEDRNAVLKGSFDVGSNLHFNALHDVKAQEGQVAMIAKLSDPGYALELSSPVPSVGLPRASLTFPYGQVSLEEREDEEAKKLVSVNGILKGHILNGVCNAQYSEEELKLRYAYKDGEMSFIPTISLPSNALSFAFKRRFSPSDKLSYWYNFDSNNWSSVYKHTVTGDYKFKAGYDSDARLGWASIWVGNEVAGAKTAPMKTKVQFMLQVPQDDVKSSLLMFRVKKRWDF